MSKLDINITKNGNRSEHTKRQQLSLKDFAESIAKKSRTNPTLSGGEGLKTETTETSLAIKNQQKNSFKTRKNEPHKNAKPFIE